MTREAADREYGREEHGRGEYHEHRVREPVDVAHDDVLPRQIAAEVLVEIVGEIDDDEQQRKAERRGNEDLPELNENVAIERPNDSAHADGCPEQGNAQPATAMLHAHDGPDQAVRRT